MSDLKVAVIADEQTVCGLILAGAGAVDGQGQKSFFVVDAQARPSDVAACFEDYTKKRPDIGMVLITQDVASQIRNFLDDFSRSGQLFPTILEIPSKNKPYDANKDPIMQRVQMFFGSNPVMEMDFDTEETQ